MLFRSLVSSHLVLVLVLVASRGTDDCTRLRLHSVTPLRAVLHRHADRRQRCANSEGEGEHVQGQVQIQVQVQQESEGLGWVGLDLQLGWRLSWNLWRSKSTLTPLKQLPAVRDPWSREKHIMW